MTDYTKLVEALQAEVESMDESCKKQLVAMASHVAELQAARPHWVSVKERLPDDSRDVLIFTASRITGVGSFIRPNWYQWYSGGGLPVDVTHWMPLPEPPEEEA